jgi:predicted nucleic acid-binding protein
VKTFVFNASPLIVLAKADLLGQMLKLPECVLIPRTVAREVMTCNDPYDPANVWLRGGAAASYLRDYPQVSEFVLAWGLGAGESSVISLAETLPQATVVLDDLAARRCAGALGLPVIGTLGLLLMAKKLGLIDEVTPALDAVLSAGLFVSKRHINAIREKAGEL